MWVSEGRCVMGGVLREDEGRRRSQENASCCRWAAEGLRAGRGGAGWTEGGRGSPGPGSQSRYMSSSGFFAGPGT